MSEMWYEKRKKFLEGIKIISTKMSNDKFSETLKIFQDQLKKHVADSVNILDHVENDYGFDATPEQNILISKTLLYIIQRLNTFLLSPVKLQSDLAGLGFDEEKSDIIVQLYSESNRGIIKGNLEESDESIIDWIVKTTIYNETSIKGKTPIARLSFRADGREVIVGDHNSEALTALFENFESIQKELDALPKNVVNK